MYTISREYWFSAAHRLEGHPKCGRLHGHNYKVVVTLESNVLVNGMVLDYGELDKIVKPIVDDILDHRYIVSNSNLEHKDPYLKAAQASRLEDIVVLPIAHSTAECIGAWLLGRISRELEEMHSTCKVFTVNVSETHRSDSEYW